METEKEFDPDEPLTVTAGTVIDIARCLAVISRETEDALKFVLKATEEATENKTRR